MDKEGWATIRDLNAERYAIQVKRSSGPSGNTCVRLSTARVNVEPGKTTETTIEIGGSSGLLAEVPRISIPPGPPWEMFHAPMDPC